jgi:Cu/Ag efflux protein CusF
MRKLSLSLAALAFILVSAVAVAERRPHEGKITNIDASARTLSIQNEKGDTFTLYWDDTTKWKSNLTAQDLQVGDSVHFDIVDKNGQMFVTEIRRTSKAKS